MQAKIVLGTGFGDEGKGITTDLLCSQSEKPIVIRFSGGQQCGHTVMLGDKKHVHSNFGSGTLRGVPSYFSEHCTIYLNTMAYEATVLREKGVTPELYINHLTKLTTPYDVAYNRITERRLCHGSCGLGIAATMKRNLETGHKLCAMDVTMPALLLAKLDKIKDYYLRILPKEDHMSFLKEAFLDLDTFKHLVENPPFLLARTSFLFNYETLIFEGSQGIMLDMDHGVFPNVTYANTTSKNAVAIIDELNSYKFASQYILPQIYYVTRCYQTRHGYGWMSSTAPVALINTEHEINVYNEWQTNFKTAEIDYKLLNYAILADKQYHTRLYTPHLVVTCLDQRPDFNFDYSQLAHSFSTFTESYSPFSKDMRKK